MALTKVTGQVIKNTTDVTVGVLTVTNTLAVGGTVSIGGTLTYEDVTNVDAVGLITARNGIVVGSGITLSKDGDIFATGVSTVTTLKVGSGVTVSSDGDGFFTGIVTATTFSGALSGSGANITAINASNIASGTVPTARLGSGTASSSTFLRGDSTFQTVNTDLVSDTSPQLGGNLDVNTKNINFGDSSGSSDDRLNFGADTDLSIYHNGTHNIISSNTSGKQLIMQSNSEVRLTGTTIRIMDENNSETCATFASDGAVELYHNNVKTAYTKSSGFEIKGGNTSDQTELQIIGNEGQDASILLGADDGDDNADYWRMYAQASDNAFTLKNYAAGSYETSIRAVGNGTVELFHDNTKRFETESAGTKARGTVKFISEDQNVTSRQNLYYLAIGTNSTSTITLAGLNGTGLVRIGGYTNAGQGAIALHIIFGGAMFATQHYQSTELQNSAMQNTSISLSKNSTNYTIAISNSSSSYSLNLSIYLESTGSVMSYAVS